MTVGIYSLYWEDQDLIYIGQSVNIETRFREHTRKLTLNIHSNYKVQGAFNKYGLPTFNIIEVGNINQLNDLEIIWQKEFNSLNSLDIVKAGFSGGEGVYNGNSKYSKIQVLLTFKMLYSFKIFQYQEISEKLNVPISLINNIISQKHHLWLAERYPTLYKRVKSLKKLRISKTREKPIKENTKVFYFIDSFGNIYKVFKLGKFAKEHNLDVSALSNLHNGKRNTHKGFKKFNALLV